MNTTVLAPVIEYCKAGLYGWDCMDCPEFAINPVVVVGMVMSLFLLLMWREQRKMKKELNEKLERLMKKKKDTKREIQMATKESQTTGNADDEKVKINRFHPRYSSTPITYQRPSSSATKKINNNTRRRIPRSTTFESTFPRQASVADEEEFQSEFSIPIPFET